MKSLMVRSKFMYAVAAALLAPLASLAADARLLFKEIGQIKEWRAEGAAVVYVKNESGQWHKAEMYEACMTLDTKNGISFLTEPDPTYGLVSKVKVGRRICTVYSLTKVS